jgi:hypothetical protein
MTSSYICGATLSPTVGRGMSSSLEEREEPRLWLVDGSRLGLPLGLLDLCDVSVSSAADVPLCLLCLCDVSVLSAADVPLGLE